MLLLIAYLPKSQVQVQKAAHNMSHIRELYYVLVEFENENDYAPHFGFTEYVNEEPKQRPNRPTGPAGR